MTHHDPFLITYMLLRDAAVLILTAFLLTISWPFGRVAEIVVSFLEKPFQPASVLCAAAYLRARMTTYYADRDIFFEGGHMLAQDMARLYQDEDDL